MRLCWNRQTGTFEGRVSADVWVQVPSTAPVLRKDLDKEVLFSYLNIDIQSLNILDAVMIYNEILLYDFIE